MWQIEKSEILALQYSQLLFITCSKSAIETLEKDAKYDQSQQ